MVQLTANVYDNAGVGDGNLTQVTRYPGGSAAPRVTQYFYDWRDRQVAEKDGVQATEDTTTNRPISYTIYDNLGEAVEQQLYDGDGVSLSTVDGVPQAPTASLLRAQTITSYDDQGHVYRTQTYLVDPTTGAVSSTPRTTNYYFDSRGNQTAVTDPLGNTTTTVYDSLGQATATIDPLNHQTTTTYDAAGNVSTVTDAGAGSVVPSVVGWRPNARKLGRVLPG